MRIFTFNEMEKVYKTHSLGLDDDNLESRLELIKKFPFSVVIEGDFIEFDNLDKWVKMHFYSNMFTSIYYGKTDYNFGYAEYFFKKNEAVEKVKNAIPNFYSTYFHAYPSAKICKSNGYYESIDYDPKDTKAIIV